MDGRVVFLAFKNPSWGLRSSNEQEFNELLARPRVKSDNCIELLNGRFHWLKNVVIGIKNKASLKTSVLVSRRLLSLTIRWLTPIMMINGSMNIYYPLVTMMILQLLIQLRSTIHKTRAEQTWWDTFLRYTVRILINFFYWCKLFFFRWHHSMLYHLHRALHTQKFCFLADYHTKNQFESQLDYANSQRLYLLLNLESVALHTKLHFSLKYDDALKHEFFQDQQSRTHSQISAQ